MIVACCGFLFTRILVANPGQVPVRAPGFRRDDAKSVGKVFINGAGPAATFNVRHNIHAVHRAVGYFGGWSFNQEFRLSWR
jgi:hypothetical protein